MNIKKTSQILELCKNKVKIFSNLQMDQFQMSRLGGLSNFIYKVQSQQKDVVYKQYSNYFQVFNNRLRENEICQILSQKNLGPYIYYCDEYQRIEQFLPYQSINVSVLQTQQYLTNSAKLLAKFHYCMPYTNVLENSIEQRLSLTNLKEELYNCIELIQKQNTKELIKSILDSIFMKQGENMTSIFDQIQYRFKTLDSPMIFCHNDLNSTNFLKDQDSQLHLIDFEYSGFNKRAFEFGNFFNEMIVDYDFPEAPYFKVQDETYLSIDQRKSFFSNYLCYSNNIDIENNASYDQIFNQLDKNNMSKWLQDNVNKLLDEAEKGRLFSHFQWFMIGILSYQYEGLQLDLEAYTKYRYNEILKLLNQKPQL